VTRRARRLVPCSGAARAIRPVASPPRTSIWVRPRCRRGPVGGRVRRVVPRMRSPVEIAGVDDLVGKRLPGGEPNPAALARPSSSVAPPLRSRRGSRAGTAGGRKTAGSRSVARAERDDRRSSGPSSAAPGGGAARAAAERFLEALEAAAPRRTRSFVSLQSRHVSRLDRRERLRLARSVSSGVARITSRRWGRGTASARLPSGWRP